MKSLVCFPEPFPDEDFRSIIFRYHLRSTNTQFSESQFELFGVRSNKQDVFPKKLNHLIEKLTIGHTFTIEGFLFNNTWYGLYKVFLSTERNERLLNNIKYGAANLGITYIGHSVLTSEIKFCPICVDDDEKKYGEVYIHRLHQISFLDICPKHYARLLSQCPLCKLNLFNLNSFVYLKSMVCSCGQKLPINYVYRNDEHVTIQISLLNDLVSLRELHHQISIEYFRYKILDKLNDIGYITPAGLILKSQLFSDLNNLPSNEILKALSLTNKSLSHGYNIFNKKSMVNFIGFYLFLAHHLGSTLVEILKPNRVMREKVTRINVLISNKKQPCIFSAGLSELIQAKQQVSSTSEVDKREMIRQRMNNFLLKNECMTRKEIRMKQYSIFTWLVKNDAEWFKDRAIKKIDSRIREMYFIEMDKDLQQKIKDAGNRIGSDYHSSVDQMTILSFLSASDRFHFKTFAHDFLPAARQEIANYVESPKQFISRVNQDIVNHNYNKE
ncbi:TniQ family protein [Paenibacillus pasadenensis]|uniref:TniQ family protein n=1 Tax=Paenibacillus pasadenensis TaxID=217090 RepID=UPI0003FD592E|nr:TniQ family protein [Paenibacillus pasadenensis]